MLTIISLLGVGGVAWLAAMVFAPSLLQILTPLLKGVVEGLTSLVADLWDGFKWTLSKSTAIMFMIALGALSYSYGWLGTECKITTVYKEKTSEISKPSSDDSLDSLMKRWLGR